MSKLKESGHYSMAGFLFQLIGTGVRKFETLKDHLKTGVAPTKIVVVEFAGQDAVVISKSGRGKPTLIQYKFTSKSAAIQPGDLREILQSFRKSVKSQGHQIGDLKYELITNRKYSKEAKEWIKNKDDTKKLKELVKKRVKSVANINQIVTIFQNMDYLQRALGDFETSIKIIGKQFGMYEDEIESGSREVLGLLTEISATAGSMESRTLDEKALLKAFTKVQSPTTLLSNESVEYRRSEVEAYKRHETSDQAITIPRPISSNIAEAVVKHPFIVVVGDGGCGKSVAAADALLECMGDSDQPPGFGLILPANEAIPDRIMKAIGNWQGKNLHGDGADWPKSFGRLKVAFANTPVAVLFIDAIDEKYGDGILPNSVRKFVCDSIFASCDEHERSRPFDLSIVITCRRPDEELPFLGRGKPIRYKPKRIDVMDFDAEEIQIALEKYDLEIDIRKRISNHFRVRQTRDRRQPTTVKAVDPHAISTISHPLFWNYFADLDTENQRRFLDGDSAPRNDIASKYLDWLRYKASIRMGDLTKIELKTILEAVAEAFAGNSANTVEKTSHWDFPCNTVRQDQIRWNELFVECETAGIIVVEETKKESKTVKMWRWKYPWFCDCLVANGDG